jgi:hypothetical protein
MARTASTGAFTSSTEPSMSSTARFAAEPERHAREHTAKLMDPKVRNIFGDASEPLSDFGLSPRKTVKPNLEVKSTAVVKGKATRKARGTMGPKKKKAIKGTVPQAPASPSATPKPTP